MTKFVNPNEDVQYKICFEYLWSLISIIIRRAPEFTGEPYIDFPDKDENAEYGDDL